MFQRVMPLVLKELASSDPTNRRNAAFCVGELCRNGGDGTLKYPIQKLFVVPFLKFEFSVPVLSIIAVCPVDKGSISCDKSS